MSLLDRRDLQPAGLLDLPRADDLFCLLSVCLNTVTGRLGGVRGIYLGSSAAYRVDIWITGRVRNYLINATKPFESLNKGDKPEHCRPLIQPGMP